MSEHVFYFDMTACTGCHACEMACKDAHGLPDGVSFRTVRSFETGEYPKPGIFYYTGCCANCENPACAAVCSTGAMHVSKEGIVVFVPEKCIGCRKCEKACPFRAISWDPETRKAAKCDLCASVQGDAPKPVCVSACPNRALDFGPERELKARYGEDLVSSIPVFEENGCRPMQLIKPKKEAYAPCPQEKRW